MSDYWLHLLGFFIRTALHVLATVHGWSAQFQHWRPWESRLAVQVYPAPGADDLQSSRYERLGSSPSTYCTDSCRSHIKSGEFQCNYDDIKLEGAVKTTTGRSTSCLCNSSEQQTQIILTFRIKIAWIQNLVFCVFMAFCIRTFKSSNQILVISDIFLWFFYIRLNVKPSDFRLLSVLPIFH